jgi:hypothetical protein
MVNSIKESGGGLALQVTKEARKAGLVHENQSRAEVYVYAFDDLLMVIDQSISMGYRADLISTAAGDTESMHTGYPASIEVAGNGYQVQLPGSQEAGFNVGDDGHVRAKDGILFIHDGTMGRLIDDLYAIRDEQVSS